MENKPKLIYITAALYDNVEDILALFYEEKEAFEFIDYVCKNPEFSNGCNRWSIRCWDIGKQVCLVKWVRPTNVMNLRELKIPWEVQWDVREEEDDR